jgi:hypothetical protein
MGTWRSTQEIWPSHTGEQVPIKSVIARRSNAHADIVSTVDDGHTIGHLEWREDVLQETGADYLVMQVRSFFLEPWTIA